ncbi:hypothetical protein [Brevundimonas sp. Root1279]|uniref:hypothetical protein n=1 Tax=Brevundimonas sp. Root1279 TaxID=1736443 RepID=UPI0006FCA5A8|nr:hypothetical protein [Brevundimonas sp. Root1279]KQW78808.1 hypothetical protein ASC65_15985 [Brevundimonas sp. Root1279]
MQNPFRHQGPDDHQRETDERRWEARDQRFDENRSWGYGGGDGGRTAEAYGRHQAQDQERYRAQARGEWSPGGRERDFGRGQPTYSADYGSQRDDWYGQASPRHDVRDREMSRRDFAQNDFGYRQGGDYGRSQGYGRSDYRGYSSQGYTPGADIWRGGGRDVEGRGRSLHSQHDFEPDYLHWREQQLQNLDRDYDEWRHERRQKFSADFDTWRQSRPRTEASGEPRTPADNPIVGDVSDGGVGSQHDAKKR